MFSEYLCTMQAILPEIPQDWQDAIGIEFHAPYFSALQMFLQSEMQSGQVVYPPLSEIFNAFASTPLDDVRVVILGQDPYHGPGQAHGLCFSVPDGIAIPPSLLNIFKEIHSDTGRVIPTSGDLTRWAAQGVLLLNATLTVRAHEAGAHQGKGWELFTDAVIDHLSQHKQGLVFMLWGKYATAKASRISSGHCVLTAAHPSPLSAYRGFLGCCHFSKANAWLKAQGQKEIHW